VPADIVPADERPDADYPLVLITGRQLEHWHTGSMTRRSGVLDAIEPDPVACCTRWSWPRLGVVPGDVVTLQSRRGQVSLYARADEGTPPGAVFVAFCWYEAAVNRLTNPALDPVAKIPEFKYCAVRLAAGGAAPRLGSFGPQACNNRRREFLSRSEQCRPAPAASHRPRRGMRVGGRLHGRWGQGSE
jgi:formate dehydrogenase major subunit